jgi:hypothetical protein
MQPVASQFTQQLGALKVLIVDDEATMRKVTRPRLVSILARPREMVKKGDNYVPAPRKMSSYKPETDPALADVVLI